MIKDFLVLLILLLDLRFVFGIYIVFSLKIDKYQFYISQLVFFII